MSKKKTSKPVEPSAVRREEPGAKTEAPKRSHEIAGFYSDEMSKEAVGGLYKDFAEADELDEGLSDKTSDAGSESDDDYINYMKSYSKTSDKRAGKGVSKAELEQLSKSGTRRTSSVSLSSRDGGRTSATLRHKNIEPDEHEDERGERRYAGESPFAAFVMANMRYLVVGLFAILLIVCLTLLLRVNSLDAKLKNAAEPAAANTELRDQLNTLLIASEGKDTEIKQLRERVSELESELTAVPVQTEPPATAPPAATPTPSTSAPGATNVPAGTSYTSVQGDSFWSIATKFYGNGSYYTKILEANGLTESDASKLKVGTVLIIPQ